MKKAGERVFLLAASNLPWDLDVAMLRRLEKRVYFLFLNIILSKIKFNNYIVLI